MGYMYTVGYYSTIKRNKTGSFVETRMDLESIIHVSKSEREKQISYINAFKGTVKKNGIDDLIYKTEPETEMKRTNIRIRGKAGRVNWELESAHAHS